MTLRIEPEFTNNGAATTGQTRSQPQASAKTGARAHFRRLKPNEMVRAGDFVANEQQGFEPWDGPSGFLADAFVKPIYRRSGNGQAAGARKSQAISDPGEP